MKFAANFEVTEGDYSAEASELQPHSLAMNWKLIGKRVARWAVPPGFQEAIKRGLSRKTEGIERDSWCEPWLDRNSRFRDKHVGQRCFILATGPSIREQDLAPLKDETCIAVSEFYKHQHYRLIKPAYYAFAPNHPPFTDDDALRELAEMKECSRDEVFFFGISDKAVVERSKLVSDWERVHYLSFGDGDYWPKEVDLSAALPSPYGAAGIAVWIAIYMKFAEIYLVGCDHDHVWKWDGVTPFTRENFYHHFYDGAPTSGHGPMSIEQELQSTLMAVRYYKWCDQMAARRGIRIFNANPRNYLGVFPRVDLASLF